MTDSRKRSSDFSQEKMARIDKPVRPSGSPMTETSRASDSVPTGAGPFTAFPVEFGRYQVQRELGRGQMGAVYLARDTALDRLVALKVARTSSSGSARILKRMEIEAKSGAKVDHPLICKVYDAGEINGVRFIALQYVEGEDVKQYMKRNGRKRKPSEAVQMILQILRALETAHENGVIHRDLKPENVMLNKKNEPIIMDFGLARSTMGPSDAGLTQGMILGTAAYMSPEQAVGKAEGIDHRSDLYALGVMLFEMLTGEWPFTGSAIEVMGKKCVQEPPSPLMLDPKLNPQLAAVCLKMIARKKEDRYHSCGEAVASMESIDLGAPVLIETPIRTKTPSVKNLKVRSESDSVKSLDILPLAPPSIPPEKGARGPQQKGKLSGGRGPFSPITRWWSSLPSAVRWLIVGTGAFLLLLPMMGFLAASKGTVQIVIDDPSLSVRFLGATIRPENDSEPIRVSTSGEHQLEVLKNDLRIESATVKLKLTKGERQRLKVSLVNGEVVEIVSQSSLKNGTDSDPQKWTLPLAGIQSKSIGMSLILIPAGEFQMGAPESEFGRGGDESPQHTVRITRPFYLGAFEVTQDEYQKVRAANPSYFTSGGRGNSLVAGQETHRFPVEQISWFDAVEFCNRLSEMDQLKRYYELTNIVRSKGSIETASVTFLGGDGYRLPTEAEWEYACRAGTTTPFNFGSTSNGSHANVDGRAPYGTAEKGPYLQRTRAVGGYQKNGFGLFDMHGNVSEWCEDVFDFQTYASRKGTTEDPLFKTGSGTRVARGGSWFGDSLHSRCAYRTAMSSGSQTELIGVRVARSIPNGR
jgi:formylglycine-generating enzyme required for sulfatase activity/predicted Ser/Thr protein kinase